MGRFGALKVGNNLEQPFCPIGSLSRKGRHQEREERQFYSSGTLNEKISKKVACFAFSSFIGGQF
jgi:hypothetical protein